MRHFAALALIVSLVMPAAAAEWAVDPARSTLSFDVSAQGSPFTTTIKTWIAEISFDPANVETAHARIVVDLTSVDSGDGQRNGMMTSKSWFDARAETYTPPAGIMPGQAIFQTTAFRQTGDTTYEADGTLSMRDVVKPVTLPFSLVITGAEAHMVGAVSIDRTLWGVGQGQFAGSDPVATEVSVRVELYATAQ